MNPDFVESAKYMNRLPTPPYIGVLKDPVIWKRGDRRLGFQGWHELIRKEARRNPSNGRLCTPRYAGVLEDPFFWKSEGEATEV